VTVKSQVTIDVDDLKVLVESAHIAAGRSPQNAADRKFLQQTADAADRGENAIRSRSDENATPDALRDFCVWLASLDTPEGADERARVTLTSIIDRARAAQDLSSVHHRDSVETKDQ
jgi:hypothetical protein